MKYYSVLHDNKAGQRGPTFAKSSGPARLWVGLDGRPSSLRKRPAILSTATLAMASRKLKIQQRTFTNWFNDRLRGNSKDEEMRVNDLETDLRDGILIIALLEQLAQRKIGRYSKNPLGAKFHCIDNLTVCFNFTKKENIKFVNIGKSKS